MSNRDELAKLHCLQSLFGSATGNDPYLAQQIKTAIEFSLTGSVYSNAPLEGFLQATLRLLREHQTFSSAGGLYHIDLGQRPYDPLWIREELILALKSLSGYEVALLFITGLRPALCSRGKYWTRRTQQHYEETLDFMDHLAVHWSTPSTTLKIIYL